MMLPRAARLVATLTCLCLLNFALAAEPSNQPAKPDPQSPEAIKQMADQLEEDRKAREAQNRERFSEQEQEQEQAKEEVREVEGVGQVIPNRPLRQNRPPVQLPAKAK